MEPEVMLLSLMMLSMVIVLVLAWKWFNSLRTAFIVMLIIGKVWAGILWAFGYDRPLFNLIIYNKIRDLTVTYTITATQFVFLSFLITLIVTISWPYIEGYLPEPIRRIEFIRR